MIREVAKELFPPGITSLQRWRLAIAGAIVILMFHVAWACGWLSYLGWGSGFAYAEDVKRVQDDITSIRQSQIEQTLFDMYLRRCSAPEGSDIRRFLTEKIQGLQNQYRELTKSYYQLPSCSDL